MYLMNVFLESLRTNKESLDILLKLITSIIALVGLFWSLGSGLKTFKNYAANKRDEQISNLLLLFSQENKAKKLSALNGITNHGNRIFQEIFLFCIIEQDYLIQSLLFDKLLELSKNHAEEVIFFNKFYIKILLKNSSYEMGSFNLSDNERKILIRYYTDVRINKEIENRFPLEYQHDISESNEIFDYAKISSKLMEGVLPHKKPRQMQGLIMDSLNLYACKIKNKQIENCIFQKNIFRHSTLKKINFKNVSFSQHNNFWESKLSQVSFEKSLFTECKFGSATFDYDCNFVDTDILNCDFRKSKHKSTTFLKLQIKNTNFKGISCKASSFSELYAVKNQFVGARFSRSKFLNSKFYACDFTATSFENCIFETLNWGGSIFKSTIFSNNCSFENVDFSGVDLKNVKFVDCTFGSHVNFKKSKNIETVVFKNCKGVKLSN